MRIRPLKPLAHLLTAQDVAAAWKCSPREIAEKARAGEIPSYKIGRLVRFDPEELDRHLQKQRRGTASDR